MKVTMFRECVTMEKLNACLGVVRSHASEMGISMKDAFYVDGTEFENLKYMCSLSRNGIVWLNFFTYGHSGHLGLAVSRTGSDEIVSVLKPDYLGFQIYHSNLWLATRQDGVVEVIAHNRMVLSNVISVEVTGFKGMLHFIRFESSDSVALVCVDLSDLNRGLFSPVSLEDFKSYLWDRLIKYGYTGGFDKFPVSYIMEQYYIINNTCFERQNYVALDINIS